MNSSKKRKKFHSMFTRGDKKKMKPPNHICKSIEEFNKLYNFKIQPSSKLDNNVILDILNGNLNLDPSYYRFIGIYYDTIEKNYSEAVKYYKMAISFGDSNAMFHLAMYYNDTEKNYSEAVKYYKMAISFGDSNAMFHLAMYYNDTEKNYSEAVRYYKMAISFGASTAMYNLALYYDDIEKNYPEVVRYYKMAISFGDYDAMYNLAVYYGNIEKNYPEAVRYYKMAISFGDSGAMLGLAWCYKNIGKNYPEAVKYYKMAIENGHEVKFEMSLVNWYIHQLTNCEISGEKTKDVIVFNQKNQFMSKTEKCPVCLEEKKCIPFECTHYFCNWCYIRVMSDSKKKCPLCRLDL